MRPLVESLSVFGNEISILEAEVLLSRLLSIWRLIFSDFGFFLVPAFVGLIVAFTSIEGGVWAMATAARASAVSAVSAAIRVLRKGVSSSGV